MPSICMECGARMVASEFGSYCPTDGCDGIRRQTLPDGRTVYWPPAEFEVLAEAKTPGTVELVDKNGRVLSPDATIGPPLGSPIDTLCGFPAVEVDDFESIDVGSVRFGTFTEILPQLEVKPLTLEELAEMAKDWPKTPTAEVNVLRLEPDLDEVCELCEVRRSPATGRCAICGY